MAFRSGSGLYDDESWSGQWCWTAARLARPWNAYAYFRRSIDLPDRPTSAVVRISADARYTLFVNGRRVHHGPARSFPHGQSYDALDLADFLHAGPNTVCAVVHQFGVPTAQSVFRDATGFLLDGTVETLGGQVALHTPTEWVCRDAAGWRKHVARVSAELGFQEHFDADADPPDWMTPEYVAKAEDGWKPPVVVAAVGGHPWVAMRARGGPLLGGEVEPFVAVVAQFTGENARGYKVAEDVFAVPAQETRKKAKVAFENPDTFLKDDDQSATLPPPPDGHFYMAVLDLGRVRTAHMILEVGEAAGDEIIDVLYLNELDKGLGPVFEPADGPASDVGAPADRYRCRPGPQRWESFSPKGFRYAAVIFRNVEKPLKIRHVAVRTVHASVEQRGAFECSEDALNQIYAVGVRTVCDCMLDAFVDGPDAGQAQRWAGVRPLARAAAYAFGEVSLLERGIRQMAESQAADGSLHAHPPSDDPRARGAAATFAWVGTLWDYYFQTGQKELLRECRPALDRALEHLARHAGADGLIGANGAPKAVRGGESSAPAVGGVAATAAAADEGRSALLNLSYLQALRWAAGVYEVLALESERARVAGRADALAAAIEKVFWDAKAKAWKDGPAAAGAPADSVSVDANALALLLRLRPEAQAAVAREVVHKGMTARRGRIVVPAPAQAAHALEALTDVGLRAEALDVVRARWGAMVAAGATTFWESWDGQSGSRCFGAAAAPVSVLPQQVLGVTPVEVGWRRVRIAPLVGSLDFARGAVPTPRGLIRVEWEKVGEDQLVVRVELPDGVEGEFAGPLGETRQLDSGATEFHT